MSDKTELIDFEIPIDYFNEATVRELIEDFIFKDGIVGIRKLTVRVEYNCTRRAIKNDHR